MSQWKEWLETPGTSYTKSKSDIEGTKKVKLSGFRSSVSRAIRTNWIVSRHIRH